MIADHFPIVEYDVQPLMGCFDNALGRYVVSSWGGRQAVDLRWVASALPWEGEFCEIHLCGAGMSHAVIVRCGFDDFMRDWSRAKGL